MLKATHILILLFFSFFFLLFFFLVEGGGEKFILKYKFLDFFSLIVKLMTGNNNVKRKRCRRCVFVGRGERAIGIGKKKNTSSGGGRAIVCILYNLLV